jgi:hypothetical protein
VAIVVSSPVGFGFDRVRDEEHFYATNWFSGNVVLDVFRGRVAEASSGTALKSLIENAAFVVSRHTACSR